MDLGSTGENGTSLSNRSQLAGISATNAMELLRVMLSIRLSQQALINEYHPADEMRCPVHFCVGQEAPPAGVCLNLRHDDYLFSGHRSHGYLLAKGGSMPGLFAELYGKATGSNSGMGGSQEISDESVNFFSGTILAGHFPIALGTAFSSQMQGDDRVTVAVIGDGGADEGIIYETLNFAALKKLPMVFICENNNYSVFSRQSDRQGKCDLSGRAKAFGIPSKSIEGNDVLSVYKAARRAVSRARKGLGPSFLEVQTYRWCPHVGPEDDDHFDYRSMDELDAWKDNCPIERLGSLLTSREIMDDSQLASLERDILEDIKESFRFAKDSPFPNSDSLYKNLLSNTDTEFDIPELDVPDIDFNFDQLPVIPGPY